MATFRMQVGPAGMLPDASGNVFFEPYTIKATNDKFNQIVLVYNDTATKDTAAGTFIVPQNYVGTPKIYIVWTSTATSGNVVWNVDYRDVGGDDTTSLDQATYVESLAVTDAAPTATDRRLTPSVSLTAGNLTAGDTVEFVVSRDGTSGSDTMTAAAQVHQVLLEYADA